MPVDDQVSIKDQVDMHFSDTRYRYSHLAQIELLLKSRRGKMPRIFAVSEIGGYQLNRELLS